MAVLLGVAPVGAAEKWTEIRSGHFRVVTNGSAREARDVLVGFDRLDAVLRETSQISTHSDVPLTIVAIKSGKQFRALGTDLREEIAGLFAPGPDTNVVLVRLDLERDVRYQVAYHEYMHSLVHQQFGVLPLWLHEGLAEVYSQSRLDSEKVLLGMPAGYHLDVLRDSVPLPLATLLAVDHESRHYNEANRATIFYAQSWALTHFLMLGEQGSRRGQLVAMLDAVASGTHPAEAARKAFGDLALLEKQFRAYISRFSFPAVAYTLPAKGAAEDLQARSLSAAEALALQATVTAVVGRPEDATRFAREAVSADATLAEAHVAAARAARRAGDTASAQAALGQAIALGSTDPLVHYGWAELTLATLAHQAPVTEVAGALERALGLKADLARALSLLAYVRVRQDATDAQAFDLVKKAIELEPGSSRHYLTLATVLYAQRQQELMPQVLDRAERLARTDNERALVARARRELQTR